MCHFKATLLILTFAAMILVCKGQVPKKSETIKANGYTLIFTPTDSVAMTDTSADDELIRKMTDTMGNWHQRYIYIEKNLSGKFKSYFRANDSILTLFLENGKELNF